MSIRSPLSLSLLSWLCALSACGLLIDVPEAEQTQSLDPPLGGASGKPLPTDPEPPCTEDCPPEQPSEPEPEPVLPKEEEPEPEPEPAPTKDCYRECDCDNDGFESTSCGGPDCDDFDKNVRPDQTAYFSHPAPNPGIGFDYNCDGQLDRAPEDVLLNCSLLLCGEGGQGFSGAVPDCGQPGTWSACVSTVSLLSLICTAQPLNTQRIARCR